MSTCRGAPAPHKNCPHGDRCDWASDRIVTPVGAGPRPLVEQITPWRQVCDVDTQKLLLQIGAVHVEVHQREVGDGHLSAFVTREPSGPGGVVEWHLSISHRTNEHPPRAGRYPTWDEIAHARYELLPDEVPFAMMLPPRSEYVALHDTTFHLHQVHPGQIGGVNGRRKKGQRRALSQQTEGNDGARRALPIGR